jgi:sortase A
MDWRWWVGDLGKTLIATGLLIFGFVAYQLWGTSVETARAQNQLKTEFDALLADSASVEAPDFAADEGGETAPATTTVDPNAFGHPVTAPDPAGGPIAALMPVEQQNVDTNDLKRNPGHFPTHRLRVDSAMPRSLVTAQRAVHLFSISLSCMPVTRSSRPP